MTPTRHVRLAVSLAFSLAASVGLATDVNDRPTVWTARAMIGGFFGLVFGSYFDWSTAAGRISID